MLLLPSLSYFHVLTDEYQAWATFTSSRKSKSCSSAWAQSACLPNSAPSIRAVVSITYSFKTGQRSTITKSTSVGPKGYVPAQSFLNVRPEDRRKYEWLFGRWSNDYGGDWLSAAAILDASHTNRQHQKPRPSDAMPWVAQPGPISMLEHRPTTDITKVFKTQKHFHTTLRTFKNGQCIVNVT